MPSFKDGWDDERRAEAIAAWDAGGFRTRVAGAAPRSPERVAEAVCFALRQTDDSVVTELVVRAFT